MGDLDVLLIGSGGRECALAWKIAQSPRLKKLYIAPGNGGTRQYGENVDIPASAVEKLAQFAQEKSIDLTIVGPDDPLALGIVDEFRARGLRIFGPSKMAAQIEASKAFAKHLMQEAGVPTAEFVVCTDYKEALKYVRQKGAPIVIKASGLALGKGVFVCGTLFEAEDALRQIMIERVFGDGGNQVVIEEFLEGPEISIHVLSDGRDYVMFPPSQDHKRIGENDTGANTGGMGTIAPVPWMEKEMMRLIDDSVIKPILETLSYRGTPFTGLLFPGIKITPKGPRVLEFNARWGDPETQVYMRLLKNDVLEVFEACVDGKLSDIKFEWEPGYAANVVLTSQGYPGQFEKGFLIEGIDTAETISAVKIFHAGTSYATGVYKTAGGRVLSVSAHGSTLPQALQRAYQSVDRISFEGKYFRSDIGAKSLKMRI